MLNINETLFLRWLRASGDWGQVTYMADHDEYGHRDPDSRREKIWAEFRDAIQCTREEDIFDDDFLRHVDPQNLTDVVWEQREGKYLRGDLPQPAKPAGNESSPWRCMAWSRISGKKKIVTVDCVGLSIKDEPGMKEFHHMIDGVKTIVQAVLGRACRVIEINAIH